MRILQRRSWSSFNPPHDTPCPCERCMVACADYQDGKINLLVLLSAIEAQDTEPLDLSFDFESPEYESAFAEAAPTLDNTEAIRRKVRQHRIAGLQLRGRL